LDSKNNSSTGIEVSILLPQEEKTVGQTVEYKPRVVVVDWLNTIWSTDLPSYSKLLACYLRRFMNDEKDMAWPSLARIEGETGLSHATVLKYLGVLEDEGWLVKQSGNFTTSNTYFASLPEELGRSCADLGVGRVLTKGRSPRDQGVGRHVTTNKQLEINNRNKGTAVPPTPQDVHDYCVEKGYPDVSDAFCNFYGSKGWVVGKTKMKNWHMAVAGWVSRDSSNQPKSTGAYL
jgi:hypothetical protein